MLKIEFNASKKYNNKFTVMKYKTTGKDMQVLFYYRTIHNNTNMNF